MSQDELKHKIQQFFKTYEYSNLITIDENGCPKGRMMENMPLGDDLVFWFATGAGYNKVAEVKKNGQTLKVRDEKGLPLFRGQVPDGQETKGRGSGGMGSGGRGRGSW